VDSTSPRRRANWRSNSLLTFFTSDLLSAVFRNAKGSTAMAMGGGTVKKGTDRIQCSSQEATTMCKGVIVQDIKENENHDVRLTSV
jgi:hypothetical protein